MKKYLILMIGIFLFSFSVVKAQSYTNSNNLFDGSTTNQLLNIAIARDKDFFNKKYVIFQTDNYNYYLVSFKEYTTSNNTINAKNTFIVRYYRESNYNSTYSYQTYEEATTSLNLNYIYVSNINANNSSASQSYETLKSDHNLINLVIIAVAILFGAFLLGRGIF